MNELVSIIVPVYNAEKYLSDALNSVIKQTYSNWECLIIDDGSTDSSQSIAERFTKHDDRFRYYFQNNKGASSARNMGVQKSSGEYIQYLDADDVIYPQKLSRMLSEYSILKRNEVLYCNMASGDHINIYKTMPKRIKTNLGKDVTFDEIYKKYAIDIAITPVCLLLKREVAVNLKWNTQFGPGEDWDYLLQILNENYILKHLPEILAIYRNTPASYSMNYNKSFRSHYQILKKWADTNPIYFAKRCALLYKRNIFLFLLKKTDKIIHPHSILKNIPSKLFIFKLLIYPFTIYFISFELLKILFKKIAVGSK